MPYLPKEFSLLSRLQDANCGLRSLVRAMKTSWQEGKLCICSFLMGQHKTESFPQAPPGPSKSTWTGGSNKQAGPLSCFSKAGPQSKVLASCRVEVAAAGVLHRAPLRLSLPPCLSPTAFSLPLSHAEQLFRGKQENHPRACGTQKTTVLIFWISALLFITCLARDQSSNRS